MKKLSIVTAVGSITIFAVSVSFAQEDATTRALKSGIVGAGTGAIAAGVSGGKAGKGALIGAGTGVIGSLLLDALTGQPSRGGYNDPYYDEYGQQEDPSKKILKDGIVGAGTGAIAAGTTGGKAGEGALIGAGTGIVGNVLLDSMTKPASPSPKRQVSTSTAPPVQQPRTKTIRKYDENGNLIYEEIIPID